MSEAVDFINRFIVSGELKKGRKALHQAGRAGLFKSDRVSFARLARRLDLPTLALRILHPSVHSPTQQPVAEPIRCEYAAALTNVGACTEAGRILETVNEELVPEALLFKAFNSIAQWDYKKASGYLQKYVTQPNLGDYQRMTGQANLIAALIYEKDPRSHQILSGLLEQARATGYTRILAYLLLRKGELEVISKNWEEAYQALTEALQISEEGSMDRFLIKKWSTIASLYAYQDRNSLTLYELEVLRDQAHSQREWETVRSLDYHKARATQEETLARRVYFGTPHASFRQQLLAEFSGLAKETEFVWQLGESSQHEINLVEGLPEVSLRSGQLGHRLLLALSLDFNRPMKMAELFGHLFPSEVFNVESSPVRVRKAVERARRALKSSGTSLELFIQGGMYSLVAREGLAVRVNIDRTPFDEYEKVRTHFAAVASFSVTDVKTVLGISQSAVMRRIREWCGGGRLIKTGSGKLTRYRVSEI